MDHGLLACLVLCTGIVSCLGATTCYSKDRTPYRHYGWKTNYDTFKRSNTATLESPQCVPIMMYYIGRHGSRYPEKSSIQQMEQYLPDIKARIANPNNTEHSMCAEDVAGIKDWTLRMNQSQAQLLVETGEREHYTIGKRFAGRLPSLLNVTYDPKKFLIRHTDTQRTKFSAKYFARGIFAKGGFEDDSLDTDLKMEEKPSKEDFLLRYYSRCAKWQSEVYKPPVKELENFDASSTMRDTLDAVTKKFGLETPLDISSLEAAYKMCAYDHIMFGVPDSKEGFPRNSSGSPWCAGFTTKELKALEYRDDIIDYYYASYGNSINAKTTCPMTMDIVKYLKMGMSDPDKAPKGVFRFAHAYTMTTMQTRLGLFKDGGALKGTNYDETRLASRLFKSTNNIPMATGIGIILFKCGDVFKVKLTVNEEEILFKDCQSKLCDVDNLLNDLGAECDYDSICNIISGSQSVHSTLLLQIQVVLAMAVAFWTYM